VIPNRTYTFTLGPGTNANYQTCHLQWVDTWHDRFDASPDPMTVQSTIIDAGAAWFGCGDDNDGVPKGANVTHTEVITSLAPLPSQTPPRPPLRVGIAGPSTLVISGDLLVTTIEWAHNSSGTARMTSEHGNNFTRTTSIDVFREVSIPSEYAETFAGPDPVEPVEVTSAQPGSIVVPGDFRRPGYARSTRALTSDELLAVADLAGALGVSGPELLAILLELTGARRDAYHPDGFYGVSNLTAAQLTVGGLPAATATAEFMAMSIRRQLAVTRTYLASLPAVSGVIPVFLTLATGQAHPGTDPVPGPLPARLLPLSGDGTQLTGADAASRVATRLTTTTPGLAAEFTQRLSELKR
jgi:hypothetical protein